MRERRRILIVEDDYIIATLLSEIIETAGWQVVGPVGHLREAVDAAASESVDAAVLDINLGGEAVYPVAEVLDQRHVPFAFLTGYGIEVLSQPFCERPRLGKPFKTQELIGTVERLVCPAGEA